MDLDRLFLVIGETGRYQICLVLFLSVSYINMVFYSMGYVFLAATPNFWCKVPFGASNISRDAILNFSVPWEVDIDGKWRRNHCKMYERNYSAFVVEGFPAVSGKQDLSAIACSQWEYDTSEVSSSLVTKWDLVCHRKWMAKTVGSIYILGYLFGSLSSGQLCDRFGRRKLMLATSVVGQLVAILSAFIPNFWVFAVLRFVMAASDMACGQAAFVMILEIVGSGWRTNAGVLGFAVWALGCLLVDFVAWFVRDVFWLQLCLAIPGAIRLLYFCLLPESPRWLVAKGRHEEALHFLRRVAKSNRKVLPIGVRLDVQVEGEQRSNPLDLVRSSVMFKRTCVMAFAWFSGSFTYYGISYNVAELGGSAYVNFALSAAVELPSYLIIYWLFARWGKPFSTAVGMCVGALFLYSTAPIPVDLTGLRVGLAMCGKFAISAAYAMVWFYAADLYPTLLRSTGMTVCSIAARLGGFLGAYVYLLVEYHRAIPAVLFASFGFVSGVLVFCMLPETRGRALPETYEEARDMGRGESVWSKCPCKSLKTTSKEEKNSSPGKTPIHNQEMELELDVLV